MKQAYKHRRGFSTMAGLALSIAALLAIAAPASAHHRHHHGGGDPAGTISAFDPDSGILTIDLAKGGSISALVTGETQIELNGGCDKGSSDSQDRHPRKARVARHSFGGHHGDHGWHHGRWHHGHQGSTDDLTPGTVVDDAVLVLADGTAVYAKVELEIPHSNPTT